MDDYYVYFLGDQGDSFLNFGEFKRLIDSEKKRFQ